METNAIALAERILLLLDQGSFTATYKYAVLLGLMDVCFANTRTRGEPPASITTRQLAEAVVELYWPQTLPFGQRDGEALRQNTQGQAEIVTLIRRFRERSVVNLSLPLTQARLAAPARFEKLVQTVEWKLIEMPLPRLQIIGGTEDRFLYEYAWTQLVARREVDAYQQGQRSTFNNTLQLKPGVGHALIRLNGLLRPLVYRQWAAMVARINQLPDAKLEGFLFGVDRTALRPLCEPLRELQGNRCFYCGERLEANPEVDHFVPWARYPNNSIDNLVLAHGPCNHSKRDFFAAERHIERWRERSVRESGRLVEISEEHQWENQPAKSLNVARALYLHLPADYRLWASREEFQAIDRTTLVRLLNRAT